MITVKCERCLKEFEGEDEGKAQHALKTHQAIAHKRGRPRKLGAINLNARRQPGESYSSWRKRKDLANERSKKYRKKITTDGEVRIAQKPVGELPQMPFHCCPKCGFNLFKLSVAMQIVESNAGDLIPS